MPNHRGRWQAQGGGVEASEAWHQEQPLAAADGVDLLVRLESQLSAAERKVRLPCFQQARTFVDRARTAGGVNATYIR